MCHAHNDVQFGGFNRERPAPTYGCEQIHGSILFVLDLRRLENRFYGILDNVGMPRSMKEGPGFDNGRL